MRGMNEQAAVILPLGKAQDQKMYAKNNDRHVSSHDESQRRRALSRIEARRRASHLPHVLFLSRRRELSEVSTVAARTTIPRYIAASPEESDEAVSVICHEYAVPAYIEPELEQLYQNIFSALPHFKAYGGLTLDTCTYIAREQGKARAIFLFRQVGRAVLVLNEGMQVDEKSLNDFARYVFSRWREVRIILFQAVRGPLERPDYPMQRHECTAQVTMPLPATEDAYLAGLGKNMRRNIR